MCPSPSKTGPVRSVVASSSAFDHPLRSSVVPWGVSCCKARPLLQLPWCGRLFWRPSRDFRCIRTLLEKRRRQHSAQIAELQMALDKAQRAAEEAPQLYGVDRCAVCSYYSTARYCTVKMCLCHGICMSLYVMVCQYVSTL